ncbi:pyrroline-5-carboxylate reductase [Paracoccus contaminans]|uniref:Pyrroline-5-carboxylate reductase n=1 Tax=Paracoccus contaminans TaxID=1945662 RepID=A0A1W6D1C8_9RHOB|nr:pyrroline-5-carboxylate reductase [Paracoccus contaminans]ARJ70886.1 pyrroline-5-carboxylate reductase [Paracoccus contaminans]
MTLAQLNERGLLLVGCGRMGGALLRGWLDRGLDPAAVRVMDPAAPGWLAERGIATQGALPEEPAVIVLAVKPQMMGAALPQVTDAARGGALVLSVAAGVTIAAYERAFPAAPVVRAMPNTPAAIGQAITAIVGNARADEADMALAETLMGAVGQVVRLTDEAQMDAVTALSGSGPAYVFHLIEALVAAGEAEGLPAPLALALARATVAGAGALAMQDGPDPAALREAVTSPGGTTAAGLAHLMDAGSGLVPLIGRTVAAAAARGRELGA